MNVIDSGLIERLINEADGSREKAAPILLRAREGTGLPLEDAASLLAIRDSALRQEIFRAAGEVKERLFGRRVVLFAPLYLSNYCTNGCLYCGFRSANRTLSRRALTPDEVVREARSLEAMGFKRVLLVIGEDPRWGVEYITTCVKAIYKETGIRIVHLNAPPAGVDEFRELKRAGVGVYQSFQETYHGPTYERLHPAGRKKDYDFRLSVMDRAMEAGFEDVGIGPLLGLYDYRFDTLASIAHSMHLYERFGAHAHTISIPRLRPAEEFGLERIEYPLSDEDLKLVVAVLRLSVPSAGVVVSTRERAELRAELLHSGASQLSAASRTNPGGYGGEKTLEQFSTDDHRPIEEVMRSIASEGYLPSLCTTCYRVGRTGSAFTEKTTAGEMERFCHLNALLTLKEYILDHAKNGTMADMESAFEKGLGELKDDALKKALLEKIKALEAGKRDLYF